MNRARLIRLILPAALVLFGCKIFEPLPTLPPVLTLEPLATEAASSAALQDSPSAPAPTHVPGIAPSATSKPAESPRKTATILAPDGANPLAWNDVPIMPGAAHSTEDQGSYSFTVDASVSDVQAYYERQMPAAGWEPFASGEGEAGNMLLMYQKGDITATIGVIDQGTDTLVLIVAE